MTEWERVLNELTGNVYPGSLLRKCLSNKNKTRQSQERPLGFAILPFVEGTSECMGRVLGKFRLRPAFRSVRTLAQIFKKPKDRLTIIWVKEIVYKVSCLDCAFT